VGARADRLLRRVWMMGGNILLFSSGHFLRVLAVRWLGLETALGKFLMLNTASISILGFENNRSKPVIQLWNDTAHLTAHTAPNLDYEIDTIVT
jgi:broad specificity phosphatase PhoE